MMNKHTAHHTRPMRWSTRIHAHSGTTASHATACPWMPPSMAVSAVNPATNTPAYTLPARSRPPARTIHGAPAIASVQIKTMSAPHRWPMAT